MVTRQWRAIQQNRRSSAFEESDLADNGPDRKEYNANYCLKKIDCHGSRVLKYSHPWWGDWVESTSWIRLKETPVPFRDAGYVIDYR